MTLAFIFQQHAEIETSVHEQLAQENTVLLARGTKDSNRLHKSWTKSRFCRDVTKALSGEQIGASEDRPPSSDEDSEVDTEDATLLQMTPKAQSQHSISWQSDTNYMPQTMRPPPLPDLHSPRLQQSAGSSTLTPLPTDCWRLIEIYCTYTQCWLPIADKLEILKLSYSYAEQGLALSSDMSNSGSYAEMWSVFAVGSTHDDASLAGESYHPWPSGRLYDIARQLIPNELGKFELGHVKALLNLALFNIHGKLFDAAWHLVGGALRLALMLAESPDAVTLRLKHVISSCFVLDSLLALHLKRRPYLDRADISWMGKIEEDGMEEWQPWGGHLNLGPSRLSNSPTLALSTFNALMELVDILRCHSLQPFEPNLFDFGMNGPIFDPHDPYNALVSGDLGSFLDDFASKHGAKKLQNQPQFMENLGFSSEVSMADLLAADTGRFMPTASNLGVDNSEESPQFPLNTFYDAG
ncbi:uncharacterized protein J4E79_008928 [Alternaria viburni]|uniref:uncharacterized protein n=1 Tax=Alternaria viburni TaxID=566460 RepID=UPI0020C2ED9C|nr:uncharacterized protein J4E79_008928 [Alternaria viburni]KAI4652621.1 hypothetical protein J4E79_008928 [Alternaria viburni]